MKEIIINKDETKNKIIMLVENGKLIEKYQNDDTDFASLIRTYTSYRDDTPLKDFKNGTLELTLFMLGLIRLTLPDVLLPSTTALGTIHPRGRELGILAGANVVMPNLSPTNVRNKYLLYDNKICTGDEAAECRHCMELRMGSIGYKVVVNRGDAINFHQINSYK